MSGRVKVEWAEVDLAAWRAAKGLTQVECAEAAGVNERTWQRWESGASRTPAFIRVSIWSGAFPMPTDKP